MTMRNSIFIKEDFCDHILAVRESALAGGFGTLKPATADMGSAEYEGMGFLGRHDLMMRALVAAHGGRPVFPGAMFFRVTKPGMEKSYVHSDRMHGDWTCIVYMSEHKDECSGTEFYRHRKTGLLEMPFPGEMRERKIFDSMNHDMRNGDDSVWEKMDFVRGVFNRAVIFHAPLFHARCPREGLGDGSDTTARMTWVCHYSV